MTYPLTTLRKKSSNPRKGAFFVLLRAQKAGQDPGRLINDYLKHACFETRDRSLLTELVYGVFRQQGFLDWQIDQFSRVKKLKRPIRLILRLGLYQLLFLDRIPDYAVVNTSVNLAKEEDGIASGRLVNGLLRNLLRSKENLPQPSKKDLILFIAVTTSHPEWMVRRWLSRWGEEKTLSLCRFNNGIPPVTLRVNRLKTDRVKVADELCAAGGVVQTTALSPEGLVVKGIFLASLPSFKRGDFYIQDEGAQLVSCLLDPKPGEHILDFCAAPGGKTTHLAELSDGKSEIIASDISKERMALLDENLGRLASPGVKREGMETVLAAGRQYDKILVDAPCSALGILRRIPEGKWRKKTAIISSYAHLQLEILEKVIPYLKPGGLLIYATCSTEREENEEVVEALTKRKKTLKIENPSMSLPPLARGYVNAQGYFTTAFNSDSMDQFFAVCWRKQS